MAATAAQSEEASRVQLSLIEGCEQVIPAPTDLTAEEAQALKAKRGIDDKRLAGIRRIRQEVDLPEGFRHWGEHAQKLLPCDAIPWSCASGRVEWQLNPDTPPIDQNGRPMKYLFRKGCGGLVGVLPGSEEAAQDLSVPLLIVEGTYQGRAVATALEGSATRYAVVQVSGCDGWMTGGAPSPEFAHIPLRGREAFFLPDSDVRTNRGVYDAAKYLRENLLDEYLARDVRIIHLPGRGNAGADDVLSRHSREHNLAMALQWIEKARGKDGQLSPRPPRKPRRNSAFFTEQGQFRPVDFWRYLEQKHHLALNGDKAVALYEGGVYRNSDSRRWNRAVEEALGNDFVPQYLSTVSEIAHSSLKVAGREVPTFLEEPLLNVANGLVDLRTGQLREHSPEVITTTQLPIEWKPRAKCPTWEALVESALPGQLERLEDVLSQALDWTRAPVKILLLYGASRAGKGLILRVLEQLMGRGNYSAVTLHQLADDRFMVAELYGKRANIAGELKPDEVRDISAVKMLTGEDPIQANKKYGSTFTFYSYAFLAFSCNKLPPINETTKAFTSRVAPFHFTVGHDGREDLTLAAKLRAELPGILVRLVKAWQRRDERGGFLPVDAATALHFGQNVDHVARFLAERTAPAERLADGLRRADLFSLWQQWCAEENLTLAARTSRNVFFEKVRNQGVRDGKDREGVYRWLVKAADNDLDGTNYSGIAPQVPEDGSDGTPNGSSEAQSSVRKVQAPTGESAPRRQKRQLSGETPKPKKSRPSQGVTTPPTSSERYGQGCLRTAVIAVIPPTAFTGEPPAGVTYICQADQLPPVATIPKAIGFDIETFNRRTDLWRHKASLSPSLGGEIRLAQISTSDTDPTLLIDVAVIGQPALDWLAQIVRSPDRVLVGHNLLFEATYLIAAGIRPLCRWWDVMLASQLIGDLPRHNLAAVAKHYISREIDKEEQTSNWGGALTRSQLAYAALDAVVVRPLAQRLRQELQATGQEHAHRLDCQMISPCADGQVRGLAVDLDRVEQCRQHATAERLQKVQTLHQLLGIENYRSALKLKEALVEHLGEAISDTQQKTLERFRSAPAVGLLLEIKALDQELKELTWLEQEQALTDGRVRPTYKILGARTGRTTTSALLPANRSQVPSDTEVFGPKAQKAGQPKPVKLGQLGFNFQGLTGERKQALHTGNPDTVLLDLDWSSIEVRLQASPRLYNDAGQRKILLEGIDPHAHIASQVCGRPITKADPERSTIGKVANFSLAYGCGVNNLARQLELAQGKPVSYAQAEKVYKAWHRFHPQISRVMAKYDKGARITEAHSLSGRRMTYRGPSIDNASICPKLELGRTNGINFPIQGSGRDLLADCLGDLWPALDTFPGAHVVGLIHDEILLEVPKAIAEEVKALALATMTSQRLQDAYLGDIPLEADAAIGESWGEVH
jgi:P4 family phage/plasmid primase-like protien